MALKTLNTFAGRASSVPAAAMLFDNVAIVIDDDTYREATLPVTCVTPAAKRYTFDTPGRDLVIAGEWHGMRAVYPRHMTRRLNSTSPSPCSRVRGAVARDPERLAPFEGEVKTRHPIAHERENARKRRVRGTACSDISGPYWPLFIGLSSSSKVARQGLLLESASSIGCLCDVEQKFPIDQSRKVELGFFGWCAK